jgi:hypothetical protein
MGNIWALKLPSYLDKWKVRTLYEPGWERRSRASGGFDGVWGVGIHHTASHATVAADKNYMWYKSSSRPMGNCLLCRDGSVLIGCAGASNTQGAGGPYATSRGIIPKDSGNRYMYSIEAANDGIGEMWTPEMQDSYPKLCVAIMDWASNETYGPPLNFGDIIAHFQWAPGRKFDPAGPSKWAPNPTGGVPNNLWNMDAFRGTCFEVFTGSQPTPPQPIPPQPTPTPEVALKDMPTVKKGSTGNAVVTLQSLLIQRGYMSDKPANRDGAFGDGTHNVVVKYQQDKGLSVDGVVGSQTWGRLGYN